MSNLGLYQKMTTVSKKVGGPLQLGGIVLASGYLTGKGIELAIKKCIKILHKKGKKSQNNKIYTIHSDGASNEGIKFTKGMKFYVLGADGDATLIEIIKDDDNPYFVSAEFLKKISDYEV